MSTFFLNKEILKLLTNLLINVSSTYFVAAALTPTGAIGDFRSIIINFSFNMFATTMYFILTVKVNNLYE
ncbi:hypothetical protein COW98_01480 [Candidatus Roizmanbacteria bacterium CG22_combo_CG10-13_8_21_14_all_35_9]|uniref:Uncharacterized protein n=3 Tax=Candidatus Roizmaniibacteriota TaxID=1752723 RepID=A0A2M8F1G9_9BACT|nr:MAG: hypothetical protein COW98_01480 [Candidatus Roizmanbacteria bacterium CG22_combo_CG10-13_8_21_14_all_35_9]PIY71421.1 MAG: hypothetical protein COY88_00280 [Candidatus Roizmanbacteria bacterium CG_4_10_14_0_8_um_filter_35_28]PJC33117.1 MAG: hypothetical protein CO048_03750 [Candidatus Roizmanbacteria bacterium CG_4_9_14_0_2_um_filter_35_15]PJC82922.1 MAG: hypothetical protein CO006_01295 [Candidatus Roizmanbacteria bacterium CG_4_8_14_3_um_filter_35_14]